MGDATIGTCPTCGAPTKGQLYRNEVLLERDAENVRLRAREARLAEALKQAKETLIFLRSVIDSGERVTLTLEHRYRDTKDKITAALEDKDDAQT